MTEMIVIAQTEALFAEFSRSGLRELQIRSGEIEIYLSTDPSSTASTSHVKADVANSPTAPLAVPASPVAAPAAPPSGTSTPPRAAYSADAIIVRAPNLGTFYGAPKPGAAAYVTVGSTVKPGTELCLIEVMKLFTTVPAEINGRIEAILAADGEMVEAGQPLFAIAAH